VNFPPRAGWIGLAEKSYPELLPHISTCKSPQGMMGALVKTYMAKRLAKEAKDVVMVSLMPCVRKQGEADRDVSESTSCDICGSLLTIRVEIDERCVLFKLRMFGTTSSASRPRKPRFFLSSLNLESEDRMIAQRTCRGNQGRRLCSHHGAAGGRA
jgi:iron only hydrogenase large subunit-like protein